jgi:hypothetical protein
MKKLINILPEIKETLNLVISDCGRLYWDQSFANLKKVERYFFITDVPVGEIRGGHAHLICKQKLIVVSGRIELSMWFGEAETKITLNRGESVLIPERVWAEQKYLEQHTILLVLCDQTYDPEDYVRDFEQFKCLKQA